MSLNTILRYSPIALLIVAVMVLLAVVLWGPADPLDGLAINPHGAHTLTELEIHFAPPGVSVWAKAFVMGCYYWDKFEMWIEPQSGRIRLRPDEIIERRRDRCTYTNPVWQFWGKGIRPEPYYPYAD